jgi:LuxR family transcriptional regulator, maltose regulon positive regulatory protein
MIESQSITRNNHFRVPGDEPLISTKMRIPPLRSKRVLRPQLTTLLEENSTRKLTLLCAPAGYGKTTLVNEWAMHTSLSTTWLELEKQDNQIERFWIYFITALQNIYPNIGKSALVMLYSADSLPIERALTSLINDIAAVTESMAIILDNYHLITEAAVHDGISFFLDHLPPQLHLMIASRSIPSLPIARLRGLGQLTELYATDLRFTLNEIEILCNQLNNYDLSPDELRLLEEQTEGWITGLQLLNLALQNHTGGRGLNFTGNHRHIADYFLEEVFEQQPNYLQDFLLYTSILDRFNSDLCNTVTKRNRSREMIDTLERENLFIVPLDESRVNYRYHRLFAEFLRNQVDTLSTEPLHDIHRRAAGWYNMQGFIAEAIDHSLAAQDFEQAAELAEQNAEMMWMTGQILTLRRWLEALPDKLLRSRSRLCLFHAWALFFLENSLYTAQARVQDAKNLLTTSYSEDLPGGENEIEGMIATILAAFAIRHENSEQAIMHSQHALALLPESRINWRSAAMLSSGIAYHSAGDVDTANRTLAETQVRSQLSGHHFCEVIATYNQGRTQIAEGHLPQAAIFFKQAIELADQYKLQLPMIGTAKIGLGYLQYEWNTLHMAMENLSEGLALCKGLGNVEAPLYAYICLAHVKRALQEPESALEYLQMAEHLAHRANHIPFVKRVDAYYARFYLMQGNVEAAERWAKRSNVPINSQSYQHEQELLTLARIWIAQGEGAEAQRMLQTLFRFVEVTGRGKSMIEILALQALAFESEGNIDEAILSLKRALALAEPGGFVRLFADEGRQMSLLLRHAASRGIAANYVSRLLSAFEDSPHTLLASSQPLIDPLSDRELEVLYLITQGLSNHQIANELFVAISTVKSHVKSIYRKLNVSNRFEAVERVYDLSLLPVEPRTNTGTTANGWK